MGQFFPGFGPSRMPGEDINMPIVFFDDFIGAYMIADDEGTNESEPGGQFSEVANSGVWLVTQPTLGATDAVAPVDNADGGQITITTPASGGNVINCQVNGEAFLLAKDRKLIWQCRLKSVTMTADLFVGLSTNTTDAHGVPPTDGIFGFKMTGDADLEFFADVTGGAAPVTTDTGFNLTADTFVVLAFEWDGIDTIRMYADAAEVARTTVNIPLDQFMSPVLCLESNGAAEVMTVDYLYVANDRVAL